MAETMTPQTPEEMTPETELTKEAEATETIELTEAAPAAEAATKAPTARRTLAAAGAVVMAAAIIAGAVLYSREQERREWRLFQIAMAETLSAEEKEAARAAATDTRALVAQNLSTQVEEEIKEAEERIAAAKKRSGAVYGGGSGRASLAYWQGINSDAKAWLRIPGTNINCPVMQSAAGDHYYQNRTAYGGSTSRGGAAWTQKATRFGGPSELSSNTVIYGHNWNNCRWNAAPSTYYPGMSQFEALMSYHYTNWAQNYPYIYYSTAAGDMTFVIFACFYTEGGDWYIYSEPNVSSMVSDAQSRSRHTFNVDVNSSDKILTLSTCTRYYGNTSNQRFVVMARLLRPGETTGGVTATYNENHRQPYVW